jgi:hypothetical protein
MKKHRGDWIRTSDLFVPNEALYQAEPRPDKAPVYSDLALALLQEGSHRTPRGTPALF